MEKNTKDSAVSSSPTDTNTFVVPVTMLSLQPYLHNLSRILHSSNQANGTHARKVVIAIAGGGNTGSSILLSSPGASSTVLASHVPYAREAMDTYLSRYLSVPFSSTLVISPSSSSSSSLSSSSGKLLLTTDQFVRTYLLRTGKYASSEAAIQLARASLQECKLLLLASNVSSLTDNANVLSSSTTISTYPSFNYLQYTKEQQSKAIGIGVASALASVPLRAGSHRIYVCLCTDTEGEQVWALNLEKGLRDRMYEDTVAGGLFISALYDYVIGKGKDTKEDTIKSVMPEASSSSSASASVITDTTIHNRDGGRKKNENNLSTVDQTLQYIHQQTPPTVTTVPQDNNRTELSSPSSNQSTDFLLEKIYTIRRSPLSSPIHQLLNSIDTIHKLQHLHTTSVDTLESWLATISSSLPSSYQSLITSSSSPPERETYTVADNLVSHILWVPETLIHLPSTPTITTKPLLHYMLNAPLPPNTIIFPGSFNPLHQGHIELSRIACQIMNRIRPLSSSSVSPWKVVYELSIANVDKPSIPYNEILYRLQQFGRVPSFVTDKDTVSSSSESSSSFSESSSSSSSTFSYPYTNGILLSGTPRFIDKAKLFPSCIFLIGYDTAIRLIQNKYYNNSDSLMIEALYELYLQGTRFLVAGRYDNNSKQFFTFEKDLRPLVPSLLVDLFISIPEDDFRMDISSTEIRAARSAQ